MGLFRRRPSPALARARQDEGIAAFWSWWRAEGHTLAESAFDGDDERARALLVRVLAERVGAIDADLSFETGAGRGSRHLLVVCAAGDPDVRDVARRWLAAAPAADEAFEYADARQPVTDPADVSIELDDNRAVDLASATVVTVVEGGKVHLELSHPEFASLSSDAQGHITFLLLDALLGEEAVERWVGEVVWAPAHEAAGRPLLDLPVLIERARSAT